MGPTNFAYSSDMNYYELTTERWLRLRFEKVSYYGNYSGRSRWQLFRVDEHIAYVQNSLLMLSKNGTSLLLDSILGIPIHTCWRMRSVSLENYVDWMVTSISWPIIKILPHGGSRVTYQNFYGVGVPKEMLGKEVPYEQLELFTFRSNTDKKFNSHTLVGNTLDFNRYLTKSFSKTRWDRVSNIKVLDVPVTTRTTVEEHVSKNF